MDLIEVDLTCRHLVRRICKVVFEQLEILLAVIAQAEMLTAAGDCIAIHSDGRAKPEHFRRFRAALDANPNVAFAKSAMRRSSITISCNRPHIMQQTASDEDNAVPISKFLSIGYDQALGIARTEHLFAD